MAGKGDVVLPTNKVWDHGDDAGKYTIVIAGDGFLATELPEFIVLAREFAAFLKTVAPFDETHCAINIHILEAYSEAALPADADDCKAYPYAAGSSPHDTFYGAQFCYGDVPRAMTVNEGFTTAQIDTFVTEAWDAVLVIVNHDADGGGNSGHFAITTTNGNWMIRAMHELGHVLELADEYPFFAGCDSDPTSYEKFGGTEPVYPNVTADRAAEEKWAAMINTPGMGGQPTLKNPNCHGCDYPWTGTPPAPPAKCDPASKAYGTKHIGTFEGAHYHHCGIYRPQYDCMMRTGDAGFCEVCQEHIRSLLETWMPECIAPTFPATSGPKAMLITVRLLARNFFLSLRPSTADSRCQIRKNRFMIKNLERGNRNSCLDLPDSPPVEPIVPGDT